MGILEGQIEKPEDGYDYANHTMRSGTVTVGGLQAEGEQVTQTNGSYQPPYDRNSPEPPMWVHNTTDPSGAKQMWVADSPFHFYSSDDRGAASHGDGDV